MDNQKYLGLSNIDIFQDLSPDDLKEMDQTTTMSSCEPGRVFYAPEDTGEVLFLLKKGRVQLYRLSPDGKKLIVAILEEGSIFGEMSFVGQGMHNTFAESIDDCTLCVMSRQDIENLIQEKPLVGIRFMEAMAVRLKKTEVKLEELAFKGIPARLSSLLLSLSAEENGASIVDGYTHQDLAEMLGTYRETTTQILNNFKGAGWIEIGRKRIVLLDQEAISDISGM
ncbi:MAG: Crp/Fnr family transcriptional regulator [Anaerolineales bacterium]